VNTKEYQSVNVEANCTQLKHRDEGKLQNRTPAIAFHILSPIELDQCVCVNFIPRLTKYRHRKNGAYLKSAFAHRGVDE